MSIDNHFIEFQLLPNEITDRASEIFKTMLIRLQTHSVSNLLIKKAQLNSGYRQLGLIKPMYQNEIHFYKKTCSKLRAFELKYHILESLIPVPDYITASSRRGSEMIVLNNLSYEGFEMKRGQLNAPPNEDHVRSIFKTYGRFHATSFCFKHEYPDKFRKQVEAFIVVSSSNVFTDQYQKIFLNVVKTSLKMLNPQIQNYLIQKLKPYLTNSLKIDLIISNFLKYHEQYGCLLHGDCSLSNIMFKYNVKTINTLLLNINYEVYFRTKHKT